MKHNSHRDAASWKLEVAFRHFLWSISLLALLVNRAHGFGGFFSEPRTPVLQASDTVIFGVHDNGGGSIDVTMQIRIQYEGVPSEFSWVLPLPAIPTVSVGSELLFQSLEEAAAPVFNMKIIEQSLSCPNSILEKERNLCDNTPDAPPAQVESAQDMSDPAQQQQDPQATILEQKSLEPYDFVIIESSRENPDSAFDWLEAHGYDQPAQSKALLRAYSEAGSVFLALRLQNGKDSGDIQPVAVKYTTTGRLATNSFAGIPMRLTSVAATDNLPMKVFSLGPSRTKPINYVEVMMDLSKVDWLGCSGSQECYREDHVLRVRDSLDTLDSRGFVTEYAGPTEPFVDLIALDVNRTAYESLNDPADFLKMMADDQVPDITLVQSILERHIPNEFVNGGLACNGNAYAPEDRGAMDLCLLKLEPVTNFDAKALFQELNKLVFKPAADAQTWFNSHDYMTHLYGEFASTSDMKNDPYFAFDRMLPDLSNIYTAVATPLCAEKVTVGVDIEVQNPDGSTATTELPAQLTCGQWYRTDKDPLFGYNGATATATQLIAHSYHGDGTHVIFPRHGGNYAQWEVDGLMEVLDSHAPDQTIPTINEDASGIGTSSATRTRSTLGRSVMLITAGLVVIPAFLLV